MTRKVNRDVLSEIQITKAIEPKSENQSKYLESLQRNTFTFGVGRAGCGKSLFAIWQAVLELLDSKSRIEKIVIIRPVIGNQFGENLGSLPGTLYEKMYPMIGSVLDNMLLFLEKQAIDKLFEYGYIEMVPLSLLRGRSFNNAFVIVEEAQNIRESAKGVYMIMSRLGTGSKMVFNGDLAQSDLRADDLALRNAIDILTDPSKPPLKSLKVVELYDKRDVQRHPLLYSIMERFGEIDGDPF